MRPVTFAGCYGGLHLPARGGATTGMVLCNPFGYDALCVHRGWRDFAERLTVAGGIPVLRFDYPGAGDSEGNEEDPQRFRAWIDSIKAAAEYLRASTGVTHLIFCGLRLGAMLAVLAAEELGGVDSLILMVPVIAGKRYVRELGMQHQSWLKTPSGRGSAQADGDSRAVGAFGFQLYADTLEELAAVDLEQHARPAARRVLLHDSCDNLSMSRLAEHYRGHGASVDMQIFTEYDKFLVDPRFSVPPRRAFDSVLEWLGFQSGTSAVEILAPAADARIDFAAGHEAPVVFEGGRYVGVFCRPHCVLEHAPAVLLVNTGGVHRVGDGRLAVLMARRLAGQGIASLRMDLGGLGDSLHHDDSPTLEAVYARHSVTDATAGVEWLIAAGYPEVVTFGVCTGAYVSIHTALVHPRVVGCMSVNLPFFFWSGPQTKPGAHHIESSKVYWRSIRTPHKWLRLLTGRSNGRAIAVELARRWYVRLTSLVSSLFEGRFGVNTSTGAIRQLLMDLDRKGVRTSLVYGSLDAGLDELAIYFGPNGSELAKLTNVTVKVLEKVDHALFSRTAREIVMTRFEEFLHERTDIEACESLLSMVDLEIEKIERSACLSTDIESVSDEFTRRVFESGLDWLAGFVMKPHAELGRRGAVCPFAKPVHNEGSLVFCAWDVKGLPFEIFLSVLSKLPALYHRLFACSPVKSQLFSMCIFLNGLKEEQYPKYIDEAHSMSKPVFMGAGLMIGEFHPLSMKEGAHSKTFRPMRSSQPVFVVRAMMPHDAIFIDRDDSPAEVRLRELLNYKLWVGKALPKEEILIIERRIKKMRLATARQN